MENVFVLLLITICGVTCKVNFVFVLTDDQDLVLNGLLPMKKTLELVADNGKTFQNAFVNSPICCPSRSSILTGKFPHNTKVTNNSITGNCASEYFQEKHEPHTISAILKRNGYKTFYAGKYLNQYGSKNGGLNHVPFGYDWWLGLKGNSKYYNYSLSINGTERFFKNDYLTDLIKKYAFDFLNQSYIRTDPFFMMLAPPAPHAPFTPAKRHENAFPNAKAVRNPAFNHSAINKHWLLQMQPNFLPPESSEILDEIQKHRLESLLAVDELIASLYSKLKSLEILNMTYIILTSDNGFHIGQFCQPWDKRQPYESDIRVPFLISGPNIPIKTLENYPITSVDIAPTILDLAGIRIPSDMDGISLKSRLFARENKGSFSRDVLIEYSGEGSPNSVDESCPWKYDDENLAECNKENWCKCQDARNNSYSCLYRISNELMYKFCQFYDEKGFVEAYDLLQDPFELHNLFYNMSEKLLLKYRSILSRLKNCAGLSCIF